VEKIGRLEWATREICQGESEMERAEVSQQGDTSLSSFLVEARVFIVVCLSFRSLSLPTDGRTVAAVARSSADARDSGATVHAAR
jgi:hypothetical protein